MRTSVCVLAALVCAPFVSHARQSADAAGALAERPAVRAALDAARRAEPATIAEQIRLCEIPAPPFTERARAEAYAGAFRDAGLRAVRIDKTGNVIGERAGREPRPRLVISAHLDTVFPKSTDVGVTRRGAVLAGPGIGDDCRGLAVLLAVARALDAARIETRGPVTFVGTVGEEGLGDLRGVKALLGETLAGGVDRFVSVDGDGHAITNVGVGSHRYRITFRGPGGHSHDSFGIANPVHAVGRAIAHLADLAVPADPRTTFNVGRVGGGTSINAIAAEAWMEVDLRSSSSPALDALDARVQQRVRQALAEENARWQQKGRITVTFDKVGDRPAGRSPADSEIVRVATDVTRALGLPVRLEEGSTDANVPMSLGIPAITVGGGGSGTGSHTLKETFDTTDSWRGTQRILLLTIALSQ